MILSQRLVQTFPDAPPFLDRDIDEGLLAELLPDQPMRQRHILGVTAFARTVAAKLGVSPHLGRQIDQVALAHDIGYAKVLNQLGFHPLDGAIYLAHRRADEDVIHAVLHHSGARETVRSVSKAAPFYATLPSFIPGLLDDIVTFCDTHTSPQGERVTIEERIAEVEARYGADSPVGRGMRAREAEFHGVRDRMAARLPHDMEVRSLEVLS